MVAIWDPVRKKIHFGYSDIYLEVGSIEFYGASIFLEVRFPNAGCSLFEALYLCTSIKFLLLLVNRGDPDRRRVWNSGLNSEDRNSHFSHENSLFLSRCLFSPFEILIPHWRNIFFQPRIYEMSKILFIGTIVPWPCSHYPRIGQMILKKAEIFSLPSSSDHSSQFLPRDVFSNVLPPGIISFLFNPTVTPQFWYSPVLDTI